VRRGQDGRYAVRNLLDTLRDIVVVTTDEYVEANGEQFDDLIDDVPTHDRADSDPTIKMTTVEEFGG